MRFSSFKIIALMVLGAFASMPSSAQDRLRIVIDQGSVDPLPIAVPDFIGKEQQEIQVGTNLAQVINNDLKRSGLFRPLDPRSFIERPSDFNAFPRFPDWRVIDAEALVTGQVVVENDGRLRVEFRLWDVFRDEQLVALQYFTQPENWRRVGHLIADAVYERLTGETGYFDTRLVYVHESGPKNLRRKRLGIMDQDGANPTYLTNGDHLVLNPRFSPTSQEIVYQSYFNNKPRVYLLNIDTGQQEVVGDFPGMTFAPRFSPDGSKIIMTLERNGNSDLYVMDLARRRSTRLTNHPSIDTSPSFSPDGRRIAFNSDRSGRQQLYTMNADGTEVRRISFGDGKYATPVWSPRGDLIAFVKMRQGRFYLGVMRPDGSGERLLTERFHIDSPTWSPNGRVLMYYAETPTRKDGSGYTTKIWSIDLTGYNEHLVNTPADASDPAWSPLIK